MVFLEVSSYDFTPLIKALLDLPTVVDIKSISFLLGGCVRCGLSASVALCEVSVAFPQFLLASYLG